MLFSRYTHKTLSFSSDVSALKASLISSLGGVVNNSFLGDIPLRIRYLAVNSVRKCSLASMKRFLNPSLAWLLQIKVWPSTIEDYRAEVAALVRDS